MISSLFCPYPAPSSKGYLPVISGQSSPCLIHDSKTQPFRSASRVIFEKNPRIGHDTCRGGTHDRVQVNRFDHVLKIHHQF